MYANQSTNALSSYPYEVTSSAQTMKLLTDKLKIQLEYEDLTHQRADNKS